VVCEHLVNNIVELSEIIRADYMGAEDFEDPPQLEPENVLPREHRLDFEDEEPPVLEMHHAAAANPPEPVVGVTAVRVPAEEAARPAERARVPLRPVIVPPERVLFPAEFVISMAEPGMAEEGGAAAEPAEDVRRLDNKRRRSKAPERYVAKGYTARSPKRVNRGRGR